MLLGWFASGRPAAAAGATDDAAPTGAPPVVVLFGAPEDAALTTRIAAELRALGFSLHIRARAEEPARAASEVTAALGDGARAAVEIDGGAGRTAVSVADTATGRVAMKQVLEAPPAATLDTLLAVRTVEFVRATLLGPVAGEPLVAARRGTTGPSNRSAGRFESSFSGGAVSARGGLGTELVVGLQLGLRLGGHVHAEAFGLAPLSDKTIPVPAGASRSVTWLAAAGLFARWPLRARGALELGAGGLAVCLRATGTPGRTDTGWGGAAYARLGGEVAISGPISLRADVIAGDAIARPVLTLADSSNLAAWGRAFVAGLAGLKLRWW